MSSPRRAVALAGLLFVAGTLHFVTPSTFDRMVPRWLPGGRRQWTVVSGVAELASAALLLGRRTRPVGAWAAAATFVAVYPANVQMALEAPPGVLATALLWLRLPLQAPLVVWALRCRTPTPPAGA